MTSSSYHPPTYTTCCRRPRYDTVGIFFTANTASQNHHCRLIRYNISRRCLLSSGGSVGSYHLRPRADLSTVLLVLNKQGQRCFKSDSTDLCMSRVPNRIPPLVYFRAVLLNAVHLLCGALKSTQIVRPKWRPAISHLPEVTTVFELQPLLLRLLPLYISTTFYGEFQTHSEDLKDNNLSHINEKHSTRLMPN